MPLLELFLTLLKSSANPIKPKETRINITGQDIKLSGFTQSKLDPIMDYNMMIPPMVGVPFLAII